MPDDDITRNSDLRALEAALAQELDFLSHDALAVLDGADGCAVVIGAAAQVLSWIEPRALCELARETVLEQQPSAAVSVWLLDESGLPRVDGALDRAALQRQLAEGSLAWFACVTPARFELRAQTSPVAWSDTALALAGLAAELLGVPALDPGEQLFARGVDSVLCVRLIAHVRERFGVELELRDVLDARRIADLAERVDQLLALGGAARAQIERVSRERAWPLSAAQLRMWLLSKLAGAGPAQHVTGGLRISGPLDHAALTRAAERLAARHESLRTVIEDEAGVPVQRVLAHMPVELRELRSAGSAVVAASRDRRGSADGAAAASWDDAQRGALGLAAPVWVAAAEGAAGSSVGALTVATEGVGARDAQVGDLDDAACVRAAAEPGFDLARGPLWRVWLYERSASEHLLVLCMHHVISDGWSMELAGRELMQLYAAERGAPVELPELELQYLDYVAWEQTQQTRFAEQVAYWREQLGADLPPLELPRTLPRRQRAGRTGRAGPTVAFELDPALTSQLRALAAEHGSSLFAVLLAGFQLWLSRMTSRETIRVGVPVLGRQRAAAEQLIGCFVNTLVLSLQVEPSADVATLVRTVDASLRGALAHADVPFERLVRELAVQRSAEHTPLFQVTYNHLRASEPTSVAGLRVERLPREPVGSPFELSLETEELAGGRVRAVFNYPVESFAPETVRELAELYVGLLWQLGASSSQRLSELSLLSREELEQLSAAHLTHPSALPDEPVHELIVRQALRRPDACALVGAGERWSFGELERKSRALALALRALGAGPDVPVGIYVPRGPRMIVAALGILRAGGAYVPLDMSYPAARLSFIVRDSQISLVLCQSAELEGVRCLSLDALLAADSDEPLAHVPVHPEQLAYVIYTSGSTGVPKGVSVGHGSLQMHLRATGALYDLDERDCALHFSSFSFDAAVENWAMTITHGARLVISDAETWTGAQTYEVVQREGVTIVYPPTAHLRLLAQHVIEHVSPEGGAILRAVCVGGEAVLREDHALIMRALGPERFINGYGPTECVVTPLLWRSFARETPEQSYAPIGRPVGERRVYLLDAELMPVPVGVVGEVYIAGGHARGYHARPALTAESFVPDPFSFSPGGRMYRTGDLGRWLPSGDVEYVGRRDAQVKLRGFRIELGEIESCLRQFPLVDDAVVVLHEPNGPGSKRLVGYVEMPSDAALPALRAHVSAALPEYMVPAQLVVVRAFPKTPNGKVDRRALPQPEAAEQSVYAAPESELERTLARLWTEVLGVELVGLDDNFFELGGDSIIALQLVSRARQLGLQLWPKQLFQHQTLRALCAGLDRSATLREVEREPVEANIPLSPIQRRFVAQAMPVPQHYNQAIVLRVKGAIEPTILAGALRRVVEQHDALRLRYTPDSFAQHYAAVGTWPLSVVAGDEVAEAWDKAQRSLDLQHGPVARAVLSTMDDGSQRLLLVAHHLVVDGVSWRVLIEDLALAYTQLERGEPLALPARSHSFRVWSERLQRYAQSAALAAELPYWLEQLEAAELPCDVPGGSLVAGRSASVRVGLTEAETELLLRRVPEAYRTQVNDVLLTALARVLCRWLDRSAISIAVEGHGREPAALGGDGELDLSRTVGWFTSLYPVRLTPSLEDSDAGLASALKTVKEQLRAVPNRGLGYGVLEQLAPKSLSQPLRARTPARVSFNYLGQVDGAFAESELFAQASEPAGQVVHEDNPLGHWLTIDGMVSEGQLSLQFQYSAEMFRVETVSGLAQQLRAELARLIEHATSAAAGGVTPSDFPLVRVTQAQLNALPLPARELEDLYPLSPLQHGMLFHSLLARELYVSQLAVDVQGLDFARFAEAWRAAVMRHEVLRTAFVELEPGAGFVQLVHKRVTLPVRERHVTWAELAGVVEAERCAPFELAAPPLVRLLLLQLPNGQQRVVVTHHHVLLDGWSLTRLFEEVLRSYAGEQVTSAPRGTYQRYIAWLGARDTEADRGFWMQRLAALEEPTLIAGAVASRELEPAAVVPVPGQGGLGDFTTGRPLGLAELSTQTAPVAMRAASDDATRRAADPSVAAHGRATDATQAGFVWSVEQSAALVQFAKRERVTANTVVQAAWAVLLQRYLGRETVAFGVTVAGRPAALPEAQTAVGLFINTVPLVLKPAPELRVGELLRALQDENVALREHEHAALSDLQRWAGSPGRALFDSLMVFENYPVDRALRGRGGALLRVLGFESYDRTNYALSLEARLDEQLSVQLKSSARQLTAAQLERLGAQLSQLLAALISSAERRLGELTLAGERDLQLLATWNETREPLADARFVHELIDAAARRTPDAVAVSAGSRSLSYAELSARSETLARYLQASGVGPDALVGVCAERSPELVISLLGVLKAGAAYLPLDPCYPRERLGTMIEDSGTKLVITQAKLLSGLPRVAADRVLCIDRDWALVDRRHGPLAHMLHEDHLAYCIYTSGSTGTPKGVELTHGGFRNYIAWALEAYRIDEIDVSALHSSIAFDLTVTSLWLPLCAGKRVALVPESDDTLGALAGLVRELDQRGARTLLKITPSHALALSALIDAPLPHVRTFVVGGEALSWEHSAALQRFAPEARVLNEYGPTETVVGCAIHDATADRTSSRTRSVPLGSAIANMQLYVLDAALQPVPAGVTGELYIGGAALARGYRGRPGLTAERFVPHPLSSRGERLYRSGDLARYRADGVLQYLGRIDHQIKLRGYRIELGEVEAALRAHPSVSDAVVVARTDAGATRLVAYVAAPMALASTRDDVADESAVGADADSRSSIVSAPHAFRGAAVVESVALTDAGATPFAANVLAARDAGGVAVETSAARLDVGPSVARGTAVSAARSGVALDAAVARTEAGARTFAADESAPCDDRHVAEAGATIFVGDESVPRDSRRVAVASARVEAGSQQPLPAGAVALREALYAKLRARLPEYMVPSQIVVLRELPLTSNGKVDRRALPAPERVQRVQRAPSGALEAQLLELWRSVLSAPDASVEDDFFELGGDSLLSLQLVSRARAAGIAISVKQIFEARTVAELAAVSRVVSSASPIAPVARDQWQPLSHAQERLWFLAQLDPDSAAYNVSGAVRLRGALDVSRLMAAFEQLIARHEALRTSFEEHDGRGMQRVQPHAELVLRTLNVRGPEAEQLARDAFAEEASRPFGLSDPSLLRVLLIGLSEHDHVLVLTMHHLVSDAATVATLIDEMQTLYQGRPLAAAKALQYVDYAVWQRSALSGAELTRQLDYFRAQLGDEHPLIALPTDRPRPAAQSFRGAGYRFALDAETSRAVQRLGRELGASTFMVLLSAFEALLYRVTGQRELRVGVPNSRRVRAELEGVVGLFVNTLVLRSELNGAATFSELLAQLKQVTLDAQANGDLPFERLVEALAPERSLSHNPLFQVMFDYQRAPLGGVRRLGDLELTPFEKDHTVTQLDLTLEIFGDGDQLYGSFTYATDLFDEPTIAKLCARFLRVLTQAVTHPTTRLAELELLDDAEREALLAYGTPRLPAAQSPQLSDASHLQAKPGASRLAPASQRPRAHDAQRGAAQPSGTSLPSAAAQSVELAIAPSALGAESESARSGAHDALRGAVAPSGALSPSAAAQSVERAVTPSALRAESESARPGVHAAHGGAAPPSGTSLPSGAAQSVELAVAPSALRAESESARSGAHDALRGAVAPSGALAPSAAAAVQGVWAEAVRSARASVEIESVFVHLRIAQQALEQPDAIALESDADGEPAWTYRELDQVSSRWAGRLRALGVGPESRVGLCVRRSPRMVVGALAILKAGAAYVPLDPSYPLARLRAMVADADVRCVVGDSQTPFAQLGAADVLCCDREDLSSYPNELPSTVRHGEQLAYVVYTSGSTGQPKGVGVSHAALAQHVAAAARDYGLSRHDRALHFASVSFDAGIEQWLSPLVHGSTLVIRGDELWSAERALEILRERRISFLDLPPSYLAELARAALSRGETLQLRACTVGGEATSREAWSLIQQGVGSATLINAYGPTESVITPMTWHAGPGVACATAYAPIGRVIGARRSYVLDADLNLVPPGVTGELYIGGVCLARGYLGRPDATAERFVPDPFTLVPGARMYRTGDLARVLADGNVEYLGRADQQAKIRGYRVELGEIEAQLLAQPGVQEAVVVAVAGRLIGYVVGMVAPESLRLQLKAALPEYMVPAQLIVLPALPHTQNGKVDRKRLPVAEQQVHRYEPPRNEREAQLCAILAEVLQVERVGRDDDFFELGGDSIRSLQVISRARKLGLVLQPRDMFQHRGAAELAKVAQALQPLAAELAPLARNAEAFRLSYAQERLWFLAQLDPSSAAYNIAGAVRVRGPLQLSALQAALDALIVRHEALRTRFETRDGEPWQRLDAPAGLPIELHDCRGPGPLPAEDLARAHVEAAAEAPLDLEHGPLVRVLSLQIADDEHVLCLVMHHIISDGWSLEIAIAELSRLYAAERAARTAQLPALPVQYVDYAAWQRSWLMGEELQRQLDYWRNTLGSEHPVLSLPTDHPRPQLPSQRGDVVELTLGEALSSRLQSFARAHDTTVFTVVLAAFQLVLHRLSGQRQLRVGVPVTNRNRVETEGVIGLFVNTQVLSSDYDPARDFEQVLARTRETVLAAQAHQDVPFERLVELLQPARSTGVNPLFQVMYNHLRRSQSLFESSSELQASTFAWRSQWSQFDLTLDTEEDVQGVVSGRLTYATDLFERATAERWADQIVRALDVLSAEPNRALGTLSWLAPEERALQLKAATAKHRRPTRGGLLHERIREQALRHRSRVACSYEGEQLSYGALELRANQWAQRLVKLGVGPDVLVGLCVERSLDLVVGVLAILKAGGAYVPIDPSAPSERVSYIVEDSRLALVLTQSALRPRFAARAELTALCLDREDVRAEATEPPVTETRPDQLAYVIYTSGSTGKPKGALLTHQNVTRLFDVTQADFAFDERDVWTLFHSYAFDFSVWELFGALLYGGAVVIVPHDVSRSPSDFFALLLREGVTVLNQTPSAFRQLAAVACAAPDSDLQALKLRRVVFGGEALELEALRPWFERFGDQRPELINMYGITETTVHVTYRPICRADLENAAVSPIGDALDDLSLYVLDEALEPCAWGVTGELYVGGPGLARGYLGRPALTAERFVPNPFGPGRLYRSGDLALRRANGALEYLGRSDHQVKIRGFRIELGEIAAQLQAHPRVRDAAVIARPGPSGQRLLGYVTCHADAGEEIVDTLKQHLRTVLPEYMVPASLIVLDQLPLTVNGKLDQARLPEQVQRTAAFVPPSTDTERKLAQIWSELLGVERVSRSDDFFELGGHSLLITQVLSRVQRQLGVTLELRTLFDAATLQALAARIDEAGTSSQPREAQLDALDALLTDLENEV